MILKKKVKLSLLMSLLPNVSKVASSVSEEIKNIVRETVEEVLYENGLLVESESNSNEVFKFRVGDRIFEGKLTKIKRVSK
jgi:hypothetical protein